MIFTATVTKGLERVSELELLEVKGIKILESTQKSILFSFDGDVETLRNLRTVDDIGIYIADLEFSEFEKSNFADLDQSFTIAINFIKSFRTLNETFSLTISRYKNNQYSEDLLKEKLSNYFAPKLGYEFTPLDHKNLDIKVVIAEERVKFQLKLFPESLYRRAYEHETAMGALRSTIAGAMIQLLGKPSPDLKIVDNFCGSGTLLCEAGVLGYSVSGGDISQEKVDITLANLKKNNIKDYTIHCHDARKTSWENNSFDLAVANFPWGKQIKTVQIAGLIDESMEEYARILKSTARVCFITDHPVNVEESIRKYFVVDKIKEYRIGYQGQTPTIIRADLRKESGLYGV